MAVPKVTTMATSATAGVATNVPPPGQKVDKEKVLQSTITSAAAASSSCKPIANVRGFLVLVVVVLLRLLLLKCPLALMHGEPVNFVYPSSSSSTNSNPSIQGDNGTIFVLQEVELDSPPP